MKLEQNIPNDGNVSVSEKALNKASEEAQSLLKDWSVTRQNQASDKQTADQLLGTCGFFDEKTVDVGKSGNDIFDTSKNVAVVGEWGDRGLWYVFGGNASKNDDGSVFIKLPNDIDKPINKSIAGGAIRLDGLHVDKQVQYRTTENADNSVTLSDIQGVRFNMHVKGYPGELHADVKQIKIQRAADGTAYMDMTVSNPMPEFARKGLAKLGVNVSGDMHVYAKVGADGQMHVDVARTAQEAMKSTQLSERAGEVLHGAEKAKNKLRDILNH